MKRVGLKQTVYMDEERRLITKLRRTQQPTLKSSLSDSKKHAIIIKKIIILQKTWRMLMESKMYNTRLVSSKKPLIKVFTLFRSFESKSTRIVVLFEKHNRNFVINLTVDEGQGALPKYYQANIGVKPILQYVYSNEIPKSGIEGPIFLKQVLPNLAAVVARSIEIFTSSDETGLLCRINLETSQRISLIEKEDRYNKDKDKKTTFKKVSIDKITEIVQKLQNHFRKYTKKKIDSRLEVIRRRNEHMHRKMGILIKSTFRRVSEEYYRIRIYSKMHASEEYYNFIITSAPGNHAEGELRFMLSYRVSENKLINCHGLELIEHLLGLLRKDGVSNQFYFERVTSNFEVIQQKSKFMANVIEEDENEHMEDNDKDDVTTFDTVLY